MFTKCVEAFCTFLQAEWHTLILHVQLCFLNILPGLSFCQLGVSERFGFRSCSTLRKSTRAHQRNAQNVNVTWEQVMVTRSGLEQSSRWFKKSCRYLKNVRSAWFNMQSCKLTLLQPRWTRSNTLGKPDFRIYRGCRICVTEEVDLNFECFLWTCDTSSEPVSRSITRCPLL